MPLSGQRRKSRDPPQLPLSLTDYPATKHFLSTPPHAIMYDILTL